MITEWFLELFVGVVEWFTSLIPTDEPPDFLTVLPGLLTDLVASTAGLGAWVPWAYLGVVASVILLLYVTFVSVKGLRWLWGLTPFSGGS